MIILVAIAGSMARAKANSVEDFTFYNYSEWQIAYIYVSNHASHEWGPNILNGYLDPGNRVKVTWPEEPGVSVFDLKVVYTDGRSTTFTRGYDLSEISRINLYHRPTGDWIEWEQ